MRYVFLDLCIHGSHIANRHGYTEVFEYVMNAVFFTETLIDKKYFRD